MVDYSAAQGRAGGIRRLLIGALLALTAAASFSVLTSPQAQAAECMTPAACYNSASWQRAIARDYFNKGVWFREQSKQFFGLAYEWNQKATWYFYAGNATAAAWSKAVADDYSKKAVANARAADDYFARAVFTNTAADGDVRRGMLLTKFYNPPPTAQQEAADAQAVGEDPDGITAAGTRTCRNPKNKEWNFAGVKMWINPSDFCYRKPNEVLGVEVSYGNDVLGPQDATIDDEECSPEGTWYNWRSRGPFSGRKITVTCRWVANPAGIPINVAEMVCKARLYLHSDGSAAYQKINEGDPTCDINGPF